MNNFSKSILGLFLTTSSAILYACDGKYSGPWYGNSIIVFLIIPLCISIIIYLFTKLFKITSKKSIRISVLSLVIISLGSLLYSSFVNTNYGESAFIKCSTLID